MVLNRFRGFFQGFFDKIARKLTECGLEPFMVSLSSLILAFIAAIGFYIGNKAEVYVLIGALLFALASLMDAIDGAMARFQDKVSDRGAFLDSMLDRAVEILIIGSITSSGMVSVFTGLLFLGTSLLISYTRSRAESIGVKMLGVGFMERAERILLLFIGLALWFIDEGLLEAILLLGSILNLITIFQRFHLVSKTLSNSKSAVRKR